MAESAPGTDLFSQMFTMKPPESAREMRALIDQFAGLMNADLPEVGAFHGAVDVSEGVTADVVVPKGAGPHPVLVYLHGGGWVCGSPTTHRKLGHRFAARRSGTMRTRRRHGGEHLRRCDDPRAQGNLSSNQAVRVPLAVETFVVRAGQRH